ncbi:hypothetical protein [Halobaculum sp. D14]|uniref:hypothetical protein n=1 Tax=Halobaculum sp. D14 TaxID=3421642 RepID=UPI003EBE889A
MTATLRTATFAVLASLLLITAVPAQVAGANAGTLTAGSVHTAPADFDAATLTNLTVDGTGDNASVVMQSGVIDDFEDASLDAAWSGDTGSATIVQSPAYHGSKAVEISGGASGAKLFRSADAPSRGDTFHVAARLGNTTSDEDAFVYFGRQSSDSWYRIELEQSTGSIVLAKSVSGTYTALDSVSMTPTGGVWFDIGVKWQSDGDINVTVTNTATGAVTTTLTADDSTFDAGAVGVTSRLETNQFDYVRTVAPTTATYVGESHQVSGARQAAIDIGTLHNASADITVEYDSGGSWTAANSTTVTSAGNVTLSLPSVASSTWRVRVEVSRTAPDAAFALRDERILFNNSAPAVAGASASPSGGATISTTDPQLSIDVSDPEFGSAQGDQVTVTFYDAADDSVIGTDTLSSNGTATTTWSNLTGGSHSWYVTVEDQYGATTTSATFTFAAPAELRLYNESAPQQLLTNTTVTVNLYFENGSGPALIVNRTVPDGVMNMTGLPVDEPFIVAAEAPGFVDRRIYVTSLTQQQNLYLLPSSASSTPVLFTLQDYTGDYPQRSTVLLVQRGINGTYRTVLGDEFGATGQFPATLKTGARHRLVLLNTDTGERRPVGTYTPLAGGEQTISVSPLGNVDIGGVAPSVIWIPGTGVIPAANSSTVGAAVSNGTENLDSWSVTVVHDPPTGSNTTLWTSPTRSTTGRATTTLNLTGLRGQLHLETTYTVGGITASETWTVQLQPQFDDFGYSLVGLLDSAPSALLPAGDVEAASRAFALLFTVLTTVVVAVATDTTSELTAGVAVLLLAAFSVIGWVGYGLVTVTGVAWIGFAALRRGVV